MTALAVQYRLEAEYCFSIACAVGSPTLQQHAVDAGLYWLRLAEQAENRERQPQASIRLSVHLGGGPRPQDFGK